jgi:hypothetical protein
MRRLFLAGLLAIAAIARLHAVDVSGVYENAGTLVGPASPAEAGPISLQGLLGLEFDYALTRTLHDQVDRVVVKQAELTFTIECKDRDGATTWSGRWQLNKGYGMEGDRVKLLFRSKRYPDDGFYFTLNTLNEGKLLAVDVQRINSTWFGPVLKPVGTFLFNRVAGK